MNVRPQHDVPALLRAYALGLVIDDKILSVIERLDAYIVDIEAQLAQDKANRDKLQAAYNEAQAAKGMWYE